MGHVEKALREARRHSSWDDPDHRYEAASCAFARRLVDDPAGAEARAALLAEVARLTLPGRINGIAQTILQFVLPGVPDISQGSELWDHSLVDPDNRRPVDFAQRRRLIDADPPALAEDDTGGARLAVMRALLGLRRSDPGLFLQGACVAVPAGPEGFALLRRHGGRALPAAVPLRGRAARLALSPEVAGRWHDLLSGAEVTVAPDFQPAPDGPLLLLTRAG